MRQSIDEFERAFVEETHVDRARRESLRRKAVLRSRQRNIEKIHKRGTARFIMLVLDDHRDGRHRDDRDVPDARVRHGLSARGAVPRAPPARAVRYVLSLRSAASTSPPAVTWPRSAWISR